MASGDLDEYQIARLLAASAPIDGFGVGTELITSRDAPALSMVYKLVEIDGEGRFKLSPGKKTYPMAKQVDRRRDPQGIFRGDVVMRSDETAEGEPLLVPIVRAGRLVNELPSLETIRARCADQLAALPERLKDLDADAGLPDQLQRSPGGRCPQTHGAGGMNTALMAIPASRQIHLHSPWIALIKRSHDQPGHGIVSLRPRRGRRTGDWIDRSEGTAVMAGTRKKPAHVRPLFDEPVFSEGVVSSDPSHFSTRHPSDNAEYNAIEQLLTKDVVSFEQSRIAANEVYELATAFGSPGPQVVQQIQKNGRIVFHSLGDSGCSDARKYSDEIRVFDQIADDVHAAAVTDRPSFLYHLGDLVYSFGESNTITTSSTSRTATIPGRSSQSPAITTRSSSRTRLRPTSRWSPSPATSAQSRR